MKFDVMIFADDYARVDLKRVSFLSMVASVVMFKYNKYQDYVITIKKSDNADIES